MTCEPIDLVMNGIYYWAYICQSGLFVWLWSMRWYGMGHVNEPSYVGRSKNLWHKSRCQKCLWLPNQCHNIMTLTLKRHKLSLKTLIFWHLIFRQLGVTNGDLWLILHVLWHISNVKRCHISCSGSKYFIWIVVSQSISRIFIKLLGSYRHFPWFLNLIKYLLDFLTKMDETTFKLGLGGNLNMVLGV
jgi:hypothetical protein